MYESRGFRVSRIILVMSLQFTLGLLLIAFLFSPLPKLHAKKEVRVYASMVADVFHYGHTNFLRQAKSFGDYLIVGLISDEDVIDYKRRPIFSLDERAKVVTACKYVDEVILNAPLIASKELIDKYQIDLVVHGDDFDQEKIDHYFSYPQAQGILRIVSYTPGISTTAIIERIKKRILDGEL